MEGGRKVIDVKSEHQKMLSLMNVVIKEREVGALKKRDVKFLSKQLEKPGKASQEEDGRSLIDTIFRPAPEAFKG